MTTDDWGIAIFFGGLAFGIIRWIVRTEGELIRGSVNTDDEMLAAATRLEGGMSSPGVKVTTHTSINVKAPTTAEFVEGEDAMVQAAAMLDKQIGHVWPLPCPQCARPIENAVQFLQAGGNCPGCGAHLSVSGVNGKFGLKVAGT